MVAALHLGHTTRVQNKKKKNERTKKKGENFASCSLDIVNYNNNYFRRPLSRRDFNKL